MFHRQILTSWFGKHYTIVPSGDTPHGGTLHAECFFDSGSSAQFLRSLDAPSNYWQQLANECSDYPDWRSRHRWTAVEGFLAEALSRGELAAFEVPGKVQGSNSQAVVSKENNSLQFRLLPATALLTEQVSEKRAFSNRQAARTFLQQRNLSDDQLRTLAAPLATATSGSSPLDTLSQALVNGEIIVSVERSPSAPPKPLPVEEVPVETPPTSLPPAAESAPQSVAEKVVDFMNDVQAAALISAAEAGSPVCEQCEKDN